MLYEAKTLKNYSLCSLDGEIGKAKEFYFDDQRWVVRYLVVETEKWLIDRKVLISPYSLIGISRAEQCISINLTKRQIEDSPPLASDKPVSKQFESEYNKFFNWPIYFVGPESGGVSMYIKPDKENKTEYDQIVAQGDPHLRSTHDVSGYRIEAGDGELGCIEDFIVDDETWDIRYLIVETLDWWPGKRILVAPQWIDKVSWGDSKIFVKVLREPFKSMPEYTIEAMLNREYEKELYQCCNCRGYWEDDKPCNS